MGGYGPWDRGWEVKPGGAAGPQPGVSPVPQLPAATACSGDRAAGPSRQNSHTSSQVMRQAPFPVPAGQSRPQPQPQVAQVAPAAVWGGAQQYPAVAAGDSPERAAALYGAQGQGRPPTLAAPMPPHIGPVPPTIPGAAPPAAGSTDPAAEFHEGQIEVDQQPVSPEQLLRQQQQRDEIIAQLIEMGFEQKKAEEALKRTSTVPSAVEWIMANP